MLDAVSNVFIVLYLLFALFWDSPDSTLIGSNLKSMLRLFVTRLGLAHRWIMYSGPFTHIVEIEARARYGDGTTEVVELPPRYEFRRYCFMLGRQRRDDLFQGFASFVESWLARQNLCPTEISIVRRTAKVPVRLGGLWGRFDVRTAPEFREAILAKRILR